jgi:hypothetical protein
MPRDIRVYVFLDRYEANRFRQHQRDDQSLGSTIRTAALNYLDYIDKKGYKVRERKQQDREQANQDVEADNQNDGFTFIQDESQL